MLPLIFYLIPFLEYFGRTIPQVGPRKREVFATGPICRTPEPLDPAEAMVWNICGSYRRVTTQT
jgi:hypothetical protein